MHTDEELVLKIHQGDLEAFDELYRRYSEKLFSYLKGLIHDHHIVEDLLQEIFMTVLRKDAFLHRGSFRAWLYTVARNRCFTHLRNIKRQRDKIQEIQDTPGTSVSSPETLTQNGEIRHLLDQALLDLSDAHREVLLLKEVSGLTYRQIADIQGVPEGTVKSRLHFAIQSLRSIFEKRKERGHAM